MAAESPDIYRYSEKYHLAILEYKKALELYPDDISLLNGLANMQMSSKKYSAALNVYDYINNIKPEKRFFSERGYCYMGLKKYRQAVEEFTREIDSHPPKINSIIVSRAVCFYELDEFENCLADCNIAIKMSPRDSYCFYLKGKCYATQKKHKHAVLEFNNAIKIRPDDRYYYSRGSSLTMLKKYSESIVDYNMALQINSQNKEAQTAIVNVSNVIKLLNS
jgi:tetratricopeptide (TPR) repeat protein